LARGVRKHIRREKARLRREILDIKERRKRIQACVSAWYDRKGMTARQKGGQSGTLKS